MIEPILTILAEGNWHSAEYLAKAVGLSEANIKAKIAYLTSCGIEIRYEVSKGYKLVLNTPLINHQQIIKNIPIQLHKSIDLHIAHIVTSTNDIIKNINLAKNKVSVLCAEYQTAARGRRAKKWINQFSSSICMSLRILVKQDPQAIYGLSLVIAIGIVEALTSIEQIDIKIKWPNDIIVLTKDSYYKLAGILIESSNNEAGFLEIIIGIGINVNLQDNIELLDNKIIDLNSLYQHKIDRNFIIARIITYILPNINSLLTNGLQPFLPRWYQLDAFYNKNIVIKYANKTINAKYMAINNNGGLITKIKDKEQVFYSGEVSLRPSNNS